MSWKLEVKKPKPKKVKASIQRDWSGIIINGSSKAPGSYTVKKGDRIGYKAKVKNAGNVIGTIRVLLMDTKNKQCLDRKKGTVGPGSFIYMDDSFTIKKDRTLKFVAQHKSGGKWVTPPDDTYGCVKGEKI